jgi:hypothetical protein
MGVFSSVDPGRPGAARQSIRASFTRRVAVPAGCLALLWLVALAAALRLALAGRSLAGSHALLVSYGLLAVAGLAAIAAGAALTGSFGRMLARDLDALAGAAQQVAGLPPAPGCRGVPGRRACPRTCGIRRRGRVGRQGPCRCPVPQNEPGTSPPRCRARGSAAAGPGRRNRPGNRPPRPVRRRSRRPGSCPPGGSRPWSETSPRRGAARRPDERPGHRQPGAGPWLAAR